MIHEETVGLIFIIAMPLTIIAFHLLDRWHQQYAWRKAYEETLLEMQERYPER